MSKATKTTNEVRNAIQNRRTVKKFKKKLFLHSRL